MEFYHFIVGFFRDGGFFLYPLAREESGRFDWQYFLQLEALLVIVIGVMFYVYSRKQ